MEGEIEDKAVEVFKGIAEYYASKMPGYIPRVYHINGVAFYINPQGREGHIPGMSIYEPLLFNPLDVAHIEAWQIAAKIYRFMMSFETLLIFGEDDRYTHIDNTSYDCERAIAYAGTVFKSPMFPHLAEDFKRRLHTAFEVYHQNHRDALALEAEMCQEAIQRSKNSGYVYLVQSPTGAYKIGRTKDPSNRMKTFTVKLPFEVDYVCVIETADMYKLEGDLHLRFNTKRVNGEWFRLEPQDVEHIKSLAVSS